MALKLKITKAAFDALNETTKGEYKANPANADEFVLDLEGYEDPVELKRAKDRVAEEARTAKAALAVSNAKIAELDAALGGDAEARARKTGDIATLEKSWEAKVTAVSTDLGGKITKREQFINRQLGDSVALQIATAIATSPTLIVPHIRSRLSVDLTGDEPVTRVLDKEGKPSAMTVAELQKEFVANPDFAAIIIASNGSGGGAPGGKQGSGGAAKKFADMTGTERGELKKSDPTRFAQESAAATKGGIRI